ncbi:unnamed protein product [Hymenolepis diminuta]|uniref:GFO_IDH_MocA domain-containing protein n=1 Tax=Hymenolepis diminuta TaxID=6216 RepID=A0A158QEQ5_HYMDI|nr:unnamed protein product [Hymenolepis diminuta]
MTSPKITKMCWGSIAVEKIGDDGNPIEGEEVSYRDAKVWPGGSCGWDWNKTGTSHEKGITRLDIEEFRNKNLEYIVLTRGQLAKLHIPPAIVKELEECNFKVIVECSPAAVESYNKLVSEGRRVAGTSHWYGITREDVEELKNKNIEYIVLTRGQWAFLHVPPAIVKELEDLNFKVIVERSPVAMETYNKLVSEGHRVAGLFHTTC